MISEVKLADELGYRGIWTTEHHGQDDGYLGAQLAALSAFATVTDRLELGTGVLLLPHYQWRQLLESAVVVDAFSGGRLQLGVGAGANELEFHLFGVDKRQRGKLVEEGAKFLRRGLLKGMLPDGPDGALVPLTPRPVQQRLPILFGGWADAAIDRAVRLGDGYLGTDAAHPEVNIPEHFRTVLKPALDRHGRSLADFRYHVTAPLWVTDDPEGDWAGDFGAAFRYQQARYVRALDSPDHDQGGSSTDFDISRVLIGPADALATRLLAMWRQAPWTELAFYYRLPGVSHERAMDHLERVMSELNPALRRAAEGDPR